MASSAEGTRRALRSPYPWAALAACIALTAFGWYALERKAYEEARVQFERRTDTAAGAIRSRMISYEQLLRAAAAFIAYSDRVSRDAWHRFIARMQAEERFPGLVSLGYAEYLPGGALGEHVARLQAEGFAEYAVRPAGKREEYAVVVFNEPYVGRNARLVGTDFLADGARRAAMDVARESGEPAITARVVLPGDVYRGMHQPQQSGFLMFVPVFLDIARDLPRRDRRNAVSGYVFAPLRMHDLMRGILEEGVLQVLDMRIYDEPGKSGQEELIDTRPPLRNGAGHEPPVFERIVNFPMPGRKWTIHFVSRPDFDAALRTERPWGVLAGGLLASAVVFLLVTALVEAWNRAQQLSMRDPLTGLYNRRYLEETIGRELPRARRLGQSVGLIVLDLDHFKHLNDSYGHEAGDFVLSRLGEMLKGATRSGDIPCRFGGEEFGVILPGASLEVARTRAEAIRAAYSSMTLDFEGARLGPFTLSAGVAALAPGDEDWAAVLRRGDRALYAAKQAGRNRVVVAEE